ncbi:diversity-generating retroelement protein Avd [Haliscomenobacter sp.]|uniref:diversity-generating retroelement protein Avd n=1 Tax=Haliscomenobacter sp. TaxID=2717303 RepID=UPI003364F4E1
MAEKENIITKVYDLLLYLIPQLAKFPRSQKFLLGDRIQIQLMDIQDALIDAYYTSAREKRPKLLRINVQLEQLRYLIRMCKDLQLLDIRRYEYIQERVNEIGKELGGWLKNLAAQ